MHADYATAAVMLYIDYTDVLFPAVAKADLMAVNIFEACTCVCVCY